MAGTKAVISAIVVIAVIAVAALFATGIIRLAPQSTTASTTTSVNTTTTVPRNTTLIQNTTESIAANIFSKESINISYSGNENETFYMQNGSTTVLQYPFTYRYEKYGNFSRIDLKMGSYPYSSYFYNGTKVVLCTGANLSTSSHAGVLCRPIQYGPALSLKGFADFGLLNLGLSSTILNLTNLTVNNSAISQNAFKGEGCREVSGLFNGTTNSTNYTFLNSNQSKKVYQTVIYNGSFHACISNASGIALNYKVSMRSTGAYLYPTLLQLNATLLSYSTNVNESYVSVLPNPT